MGTLRIAAALLALGLTGCGPAVVATEAQPVLPPAPTRVGSCHVLGADTAENRSAIVMQGFSAVVLGDSAYVCDCEQRSLAGDTEQRAVAGDTEGRDLAGDTEGRDLAGDTEGRDLAGDTEGRDLAGDTEGRDLAGDTEGRDLAGDTEGRDLAGDTEGRDLAGDTEGRDLAGATEGRDLAGATQVITCEVVASCPGFRVGGTLPVSYDSGQGLVPAPDRCVQ